MYTSCLEDWVDITVFARCVCHHVSLCIVKVKQAVEVVFHSFRDFDFLLLSVFVGHGDYIVLCLLYCRFGLECPAS